MAPLSVEATRQMVTVKALVDLIQTHPFFSSLVMPMEMVETDADGFIPGTGEFIPAMAPDSKTLYYTPNGWLRGMTRQETLSVLIHEAGHIVLAHHLRLGSRDPKRFNLAADYELNNFMIKSGYVMPDGCLHNKEWDGLTAEAIYELLPPDPPSGGKSGSGHGKGKGSGTRPSVGQMGDVLRPVNKDNPGRPITKEQEEQLKRELAGNLIRARQIAKRQGKMPGAFSELIDNFTEPQVKWEDLLAAFAARVFQSGFTWRKPNTKFVSQGIYLPGPEMDGIGPLVLAIDTSGSISKEELQIFAGEVEAIVMKHKPIKTWVIYCDAKVQRVDEYKPGDTFQFAVTGRGGTRFEPVFEYVAKEGIEAEAVVYFTDLYGSHPAEPPPYPVLWLSTSGKTMKAPFGETIPVRPEVVV